MDLSFLEAIFLGLVQGLTEFLPISSSGHLIVVPWLFNIPSPSLEYDAALHLGTLVAVLIYFRNDFLAMARAIPRALQAPRALITSVPQNETDRNAKLLWLIALGCVPGALVGLSLESNIEELYHDTSHQTRAVVIVAIAMILLGVALLIAERVAQHRRGLKTLNVKDALIIGVAQALAALVPGVSRSGATITAGLFRDFKRADAARFSFLLGAPLIAGAGAKSLADIAGSDFTNREYGIFLVGIVTAAVSGLFAITFLLRFLQSQSTIVFVIYRFVFGLMVLGLVISGVK
jgi:undecaprenyl-diphosphatase